METISFAFFLSRKEFMKSDAFLRIATLRYAFLRIATLRYASLRIDTHRYASIRIEKTAEMETISFPFFSFKKRVYEI